MPAYTAYIKAMHCFKAFLWNNANASQTFFYVCVSPKGRCISAKAPNYTKRIVAIVNRAEPIRTEPDCSGFTLIYVDSEVPENMEKATLSLVEEEQL